MNIAAHRSLGLAGELDEPRLDCSIRQDSSAYDPATFEAYVEQLRQGVAGAQRVAAASKILTQEAQHAVLSTKAAIGCLNESISDPYRLYAIDERTPLIVHSDAADNSEPNAMKPSNVQKGGVFDGSASVEYANLALVVDEMRSLLFVHGVQLSSLQKQCRKQSGYSFL